MRMGCRLSVGLWLLGLLAGACRPSTTNPVNVDSAKQALAQPSWTEVANESPTQRVGARMAYDARRGRVVMFGGQIGAALTQETWEWDGVRWARILATGPSPRRDVAMAYDAARARVVLFGGASSGGVFKDTWQWDGTTWSKVTTTDAPGSRSGATMVYDAARARLVLFGGVDVTSTLPSDTWELDGAQWQRIVVAGPPGRTAHAMAYDAARARTVLYGGYPALDDTWEWDGQSWSRLAGGTSATPGRRAAVGELDETVWAFGGETPAGYTDRFLERRRNTDAWLEVEQGSDRPSRRAGATMAIDRARNVLVLFGGEDDTGALGDTWEWDGERWREKIPRGVSPVPRVAHAMTYSALLGGVVIYGGTDESASKRGALLADLWRWDGDEWILLDDDAPPGKRSGHAMAADETRALYISGGEAARSRGRVLADDLWTFNGSQWTQTSSYVLARKNHAMVFDAIFNRVCVLGGSDDDHIFMEEQTVCSVSGGGAVDYESMDNRPISGEYASAFYLKHRDERVVVAGDVGSGARGDIWVLPAFAQHWDLIGQSATGARQDHTLAYDPTRQKVLLLDGATTDPYAGSRMWQWTGAVWQPVTVAGLQRRSGHVVATDSGRGRIVLFGGTTSSGAVSDTWEWNGTGWTEMVTSRPSGVAPLMAFHSASGKAVLYTNSGGTNSPTWLWDGTRWSIAATSGPGNHSSGVMAYFGPSAQVILYGGTTTDTATWAWNGLGWSTVGGPGPPARNSAAIAYDIARGKLVMFGGLRVVDGSILAETWEWSANAWTLRSSTGPAPRFGHSMVYDNARGKVLLYGGSTTTGTVTLRSDVWQWDGSEWSEVSGGGPSARAGATMGYDPTRQRTLLFGGYNGTVALAETLEWDGDTWSTIGVAGPPARSGAASAFDEVRRRWVMFGGGARNDTWVYAVRGNDCTAGWQCNSGYCVDGVCCDQFACGTCERCSVAGSEGQCVPVSGNDVDSCTDGKSCIIKNVGAGDVGVCGRPAGALCSANGDCHSGNCVDGVCCDSACTGDCQRCDLPSAVGTCLPLPLSDASTGRGDICGAYLCTGASPSCATTCTNDTFCIADHYCAADGHCQMRKSVGAACDLAAGVDCLVNRCRACATDFCTDGVCCDGLCDGGCQACAASTGAITDGQCTTRAIGVAGRASCAAYLCGGDPACPTTCDADSDCVDGGGALYCIDGQCQGQLPLGLACQSAGDCASGFCVDGICCASACDGVCAACDVPGLVGTCSFTEVARDGDCSGQGSCRGVCTGTSPSDATCDYPGSDTACGVCVACDGSGACNRAPSSLADVKCPAIDCSGLDTECRHYRSATRVPQCIAAGLCATASDPGVCEDDTVADGTACSAGVCRAGECTSETPPTNPSCAMTTTSSVPSDTLLVSFVLLGISAVARRLRRTSFRCARATRPTA